MGSSRIELTAGWCVASVASGRAVNPHALAEALTDADWIAAQCPGTAASALREAGLWSWDEERDFDAEDWWFRCRFSGRDFASGSHHTLRFGGLATLANVWLNGQHLLASESMWLAHDVDVTHMLTAENELFIHCAALSTALAARRPRPRWRTRLVEHQQLRWFRTTLMGRMPGWTPATAVVGPWRGISLTTDDTIGVSDTSLLASLEGDAGVLAVTFSASLPPSIATVRATLHCQRRGAGRDATNHSAGLSAGLTVSAGTATDRASFAGTLVVPGADKWWPHTHGDPALYEVSVTITAGTETSTIALGRVGFRAIRADRGIDGRGFGLEINGARVFARGTCWVPLDAVSMNAGQTAYANAVGQARAAGFNLLRLSGATVYEADAFHDACDEQGVLVWQDFMFANMDYPAGDANFSALVQREAQQFFARNAHRPSLAVLCGGSEVAQQASMLGLPAEAWSGPLYDEILPGLCATLAPGVPYVANSPSGGALPFLSNEGVAHYYGVGAYLRPLEDARRAGVRFTSECLGFSNVPEPRTVEMVTGSAAPAPHLSRWKARVPRDRGAGWDFEDVRDHYFRTIFGIDPLAVRYADAERYLALSRVATGEVIGRTLAEWRRPGSGCNGSLIWMHRDVWPGAGWGIIDATGVPKAAYWFAARACAPIALAVTDEGVNGLAFHVLNDVATPMDADLSLSLWNDAVEVASGTAPVNVGARAATSVSADAVLGRFTDVAYAYRFGPPGHDLVSATLRDRASGMLLAEAYYFPLGVSPLVRPDVGAAARAWPVSGGTWTLSVTARTAAVAVALDIPGFVPADSYFHIAPGATKLVTLVADGTTPRPSGTVYPLNATQPERIVVLASAAEPPPAVSGPA